MGCSAVNGWSPVQARWLDGGLFCVIASRDVWVVYEMDSRLVGESVTCFFVADEPVAEYL